MATADLHAAHQRVADRPGVRDPGFKRQVGWKAVIFAVTRPQAVFLRRRPIEPGGGQQRDQRQAGSTGTAQKRMRKRAIKTPTADSRSQCPIVKIQPGFTSGGAVLTHQRGDPARAFELPVAGHRGSTLLSSHQAVAAAKRVAPVFRLHIRGDLRGAPSAVFPQAAQRSPRTAT